MLLEPYGHSARMLDDKTTRELNTLSKRMFFTHRITRHLMLYQGFDVSYITQELLHLGLKREMQKYQDKLEKVQNPKSKFRPHVPDSENNWGLSLCLVLLSRNYLHCF